MTPESNYDYEEFHSKRFLPSDDPLDTEIQINNYTYPISHRTDPRIKNFNYHNPSSYFNKLKTSYKKAGLFKKNKTKKQNKIHKINKHKTKNLKKKRKSKKTKKY